MLTRVGVPLSQRCTPQDSIVPADAFRGAPLPWWGKIAAKLLLSRVPVSHSVWAKLNIFRHSYSSRDPDEQVRAARGRIEVFRDRMGHVPHTILELGPGEITTCAVAYKALGVARTIFVDSGDFGEAEVTAYTEVAAALRNMGFAPPDLSGARDRADVFARCGIEYYTNGLTDLQSLPSDTADFITSSVVIEHIRLRELAQTFAELRRIVTPYGLCWHTIDFHDHLGGKLVNLRFSPSMWESRFMSTSGFYTNRASASQVVQLMQRAGYEIEVVSRSVWPEPAIARSKVAPELSELWTDEDLRVCSMSLIARRARGPLPG